MTVFFIALGVVAFFVLAISITLIVKGRNIQGDVGDNPNMQRLGLRCTVEEMSDGGVNCPSAPEGGCSTCSDKERNCC